jgi:hypothetical protein
MIGKPAKTLIDSLTEENSGFNELQIKTLQALFSEIYIVSLSTPSDDSMNQYISDYWDEIYKEFPNLEEIIKGSVFIEWWNEQSEEVKDSLVSPTASEVISALQKYITDTEIK